MPLMKPDGRHAGWDHLIQRLHDDVADEPLAPPPYSEAELCAGAEEAIYAVKPEWADRLRWVEVKEEQAADAMEMPTFVKTGRLNPKGNVPGQLLEMALSYWKTIGSRLQKRDLTVSSQMLVLPSHSEIRQDATIWETGRTWSAEWDKRRTVAKITLKTRFVVGAS